MLTSCPSAGKAVGRVRTSKIRPGFKKPLRPIIEAPPLDSAEPLSFSIPQSPRCNDVGAFLHGNGKEPPASHPDKRFFGWDSVSYVKYAPRNSHQARAFQRRTPRTQSEALGRRKCTPVRQMQ